MTEDMEESNDWIDNIDTPIMYYDCNPGDPQWDEAWGFIKDEFGDDFDKQSDCGECWQYMGTFMRPDMVWRHQFRHRDFLGSRLIRNYASKLPPVRRNEEQS